MEKILDQHGGVLTTFHREDGKSIIKKSQDVGEILRLNSIDRNHASQTKGLRKAASIPETVAEQWNEELRKMGRPPNLLAPENRVWLLNRLNNSSYRKLRTNEDRL